MTTKAVKIRRKRPVQPVTPHSLVDVTRWVPASVQNLLWGIAAGRCEFEGCNKTLWKNDLTQDVRVLGEKAHIRAFSANGPRGSNGGTHEELNDINNLILLCPVCHLTIDKGDGPKKYSVERIRSMKRAHEVRIDAACNISEKRRSNILTYATHIGAHHALPTMRDASLALLQKRRYPSSAVIDLSTRDGADPKVEDDFWVREANRLTSQFDRQVRQPLERGEIDHISCFALASQPLLIKLGTLLGDILPVETYQRHREPTTWAWPSEESGLSFDVLEPPTTTGTPALVLSISATVTNDRIQRLLGTDVSTWVVTISSPNNDIVKSPATLAAFRATIRPLLDKIKRVHGTQSALHVFPAVPASIAVEFGRVRMPKADMPWLLYDEQSSRGGFIPALSIELGQ